MKEKKFKIQIEQAYNMYYPSVLVSYYVVLRLHIKCEWVFMMITDSNFSEILHEETINKGADLTKEEIKEINETFDSLDHFDAVSMLQAYLEGLSNEETINQRTD